MTISGLSSAVAVCQGRRQEGFVIRRGFRHPHSVGAGRRSRQARADAHVGQHHHRPVEFDALAETVKDAIGVPARDIRRDYWLTRCLHLPATETERTGRLSFGHASPALAGSVVAVGGGTSLISAWDRAGRIASDLAVGL